MMSPKWAFGAKAPRTGALRVALLALPTVAVVVVALSWFVLGREKPVLAARVYAGPAPVASAGAPIHVAFRAQILSSFHSVETPQQGEWTVTLSGGQEAWSQTVHSDAQGVIALNTQLSLRSRRAPLRIRLSRGDELLAEGDWTTSATAYPRRAGAEFLKEKLPGGVSLGLSLSRGVLAVPFENELSVRLAKNDRPLSGVPLKVSLDGARILSPPPLTTDADGRVSVALQSKSHHVEVFIRAKLAGEESYSRQFVLPVVAGAIAVKLTGGMLTVESPVPRRFAYLNIANEQRTLRAYNLELEPAGTGARGTLTLPELPGPLWAMTSSEFDFQSMALVGWPIGPPLERQTLDRRDVLMIDGFKPARAAEAARRTSMRQFGTAIALLVMLLEVGVLLRYTQLRNASLQDAPAELSAVTTSGRAPAFVAVVLLAAGFAALIALIAARL